MRTYTFIISILISFLTFGQEKTKDTIKFKDFELRIGTDISKFVKTSIIKDYNAFEINADFRFAKRYYLAGEFGREKRTLDETQINSTTEGNYFKVGIDYNTYENWLDMQNMIFVGLRYGLSTFNNTLNSYSILNNNSYWLENGLVTTPIEYEKSTTHFIELLIGIKAEIFNNLYLGINLQLKKYIIDNSPSNFQNIYVPGFGKTTDDSKWGVGFGYTINYLIPFHK
jgi:hypothetical protein